VVENDKRRMRRIKENYSSHKLPITALVIIELRCCCVVSRSTTLVIAAFEYRINLFVRTQQHNLTTFHINNRITGKFMLIIHTNVS
jgi:hypothetical protein